jgi:hypothetical protein
MIALQDLCVIENINKNICTNADLSKLGISNKNAKSFFKEAFEAGFLCPSIRMMNNQITLNYNADDKYIRFDISSDNIIFTYGKIGHQLKSGTISDSKKQLKVLNEFVFPKSKALLI